MNKTFTTILFLLGIMSIAFAQLPPGFSYQAVARDANGICLSDTLISLRISIQDDSAATNPIYEEVFSSIPTNDAGLFQLTIGTGNRQNGSPEFSELDWNMNGTSRHLKVELSPNNDLNFVEVGMSQLMTVPFAMAAENGLRYDQSRGDEFLPWHGPNGNRNGIMGGTGSSVDNGLLELYDDTGDRQVSLRAAESTNDEDVGMLWLYGDNSNENFILGWSGDRDHGALGIYDANGDIKVNLQSEDFWNGAGRANFYGPNGTINVEIGISNSTQTNGDNRGAIRLHDENEINKSNYAITTSGSGYFDLDGPNGNLNVALTNDSNPNHGYIAAANVNGTHQAKLYVNNTGNGVLECTGPTGGIKNFVMPHPTKPNKEIVYACVEGPEAAAYERGTAQLINGEAVISFSETFEIVANPGTMTVMTSPWSADSKGLAIVERTANGFRVKELGGGTGNYQFDWEAKAVRKGWEDFSAIRDKFVQPDEMDEVR